MRVAGECWEGHAVRFLERAGLRVRERNFRCRLGEIDLIMLDGGTLVFVEVRFRRNQDFGGALASIGPSKRRRLLRTARFYLSCNPRYAERPCRFDVVCITGASQPRYQWITNAIEEPTRR